MLRRPLNRRVLQPSLVHLAAQVIGVLPNRWASSEVMLMGQIRLGLLPNAFVEI
jgi:hypothetical protein